MKILIVEDDRTLNNGIALSLGDDDILQAFSIGEAEKLLDSRIDLMILDINLPDGSGLDFCRKIRQTGSLPIIFLTANDMEIDIVTGLETGADDYITKPFSLAVLRARVNAVLRRRQNDNTVFRSGNFVFDFDSMKFLVGNTPVELSKTEQRLLKIFVQNPGQTMPREMLLDRVWTDHAEFVEENALSVAVNRLRQKLPGVPIKSIYGIGYVWEPQK
ncbi:MAG: response regulator transcription factor [Lachnospiraceae bacterium]|nr:response regulator transcription factor [Lachnospiraceae bacterium]MDE7273983.1 response regulator transcription factor [Lachnospiraceae bacterium]